MLGQVSYPCPDCNANDWIHVRQEVIRRSPKCNNCGYSPMEIAMQHVPTGDEAITFLKRLAKEEGDARATLDQATRAAVNAKGTPVHDQLVARMESAEALHGIATKKLAVLSTLCDVMKLTPKSGKISFYLPEIGFGYQFEWSST